MLTTISRQQGFNLIELMVGMALGLVVTGAVISFIASTIQASNATMGATRLTQELRALSEIIARDIRRARSMQDPIVDVGSACVVTPTAPAVCSTATPPKLCDATTTPSCNPAQVICCAQQTKNLRAISYDPVPTTASPLASCVIYAYEGAVGGTHRAIRRVESSGVGSIVLLRQATVPTCADAGSSGTTVSSPLVDITAFEITPRDETGAVNVNGDRIDLRLVGKLRGDAQGITREFRTSVFVRSGRS